MIFQYNVIAYIISRINASNKDEQEQEQKDESFRYAPSSIYLNDLLDANIDESILFDEKNNAAIRNLFNFEKSYTSFPVLDPSSTTAIPNNTLFTMPEVMTATATPLFYKEPHHKPIWAV